MITGEIYKIENDWYEYKLQDENGNVWDSYIECYNGVQELSKIDAAIALQGALLECNKNGNRKDYGFSDYQFLEV